MALGLKEQVGPSEEEIQCLTQRRGQRKKGQLAEGRGHVTTQVGAMSKLTEVPGDNRNKRLLDRPPRQALGW